MIMILTHRNCNGNCNNLMITSNQNRNYRDVINQTQFATEVYIMETTIETYGSTDPQYLECCILTQSAIQM
jgi:hypothetical protein